MRRGEVRWVAFGPGARGCEIGEQRPALIVSNDAANRHLNRVQVVPLTTDVRRLYPSEARVAVGEREHKAMADQLTTVSKRRLTNRTGRHSREDLGKVERAARMQLGL